MNKLIHEKPSIVRENFLLEYKCLFDVDIEECKKLLKSKEYFQPLTDKWYYYMNMNDYRCAFKVYNAENYFLDAFDCYQSYSRDYLRSVLKSPVYNKLKNIKSFVDLGCGIGYSTIGLKEMFPNAKAYATNLKDTKQWTFCKAIFKKRGINLIGSTNEINHNVDLVFASEYFEHVLEPIDHVEDIINNLSPKYLIIANSFNTKSIGHFDYYSCKPEHHKQKPEIYSYIPKSKISRLFNKFLIEKGYTRVKVKMWNDRPAVWKKNEP